MLYSFLLIAIGAAAPARPTSYPINATIAARVVDDAQILANVNAINSGEVEAAKLATSKASSKAVRDYAAMMVQDHGKALAAGTAMAGKMSGSAEVDTALSMGHAREMARLNQLSGSAFDKQFVQDMVDDHTMAVNSLKSWGNSAKDPQLKSWIEGLVPTVQGHLDRAKGLSSM